MENIKRVADYWCSGNCEKAAALPQSTFNEVLGIVLAKEQAKLIEAEEMARESKRADDQTQMRNASRQRG